MTSGASACPPADFFPPERLAFFGGAALFRSTDALPSRLVARACAARNSTRIAAGSRSAIGSAAAVACAALALARFDSPG
ncbi:MAG: hypothetical protein M3327_13860, partial [Actinomycetota bacterium]|nr:hypothetical protein [Actinomycetota bacterium]